MDGEEVEEEVGEEVEKEVGEGIEVEEEVGEVVEDAALVLDAHGDGDVFVVRISPDGRLLASGGEDDRALLTELEAVDERGAVPIPGEHIDSVTCIEFNASGSLLASGDMSGRIVVTTISSRETNCQMTECSDLEWLVWHPSADILFAGAGDGLVWMWLVSATGIARTKVFSAGINMACTDGKLYADGSSLLACYKDGSVLFWSLRDGKFQSIQMNSICNVAAVHKKFPLAAVGCENGSVAILNTNGGKLTQIIPAVQSDGGVDENCETQSVEDLSFSGTHPWLAIGRCDGQLTIFDVVTMTTRYVFRHETALIACSWLTDGATVVSTGHDGTIKISNAGDGRDVDSYSSGGDQAFCMDLAVVNDVQMVVLGCRTGLLRIFHLEDVSL